MAAVTPMHPRAGKSGAGSSPLVNIVRIVVLIVLAGGSAYLLLTHREWFENPQLLKQEVLSWGVWGPTAYIFLFAVGPSFLVPGAVMTIAGGLAFGMFWGAAYAMIGADLGALLAFMAGRFLGRSFVEHVIGNRFNDIMGRLSRNGFFIILYLRIVPVIPYNALNLLAGASPITFRDYVWASAVGMVPGTILFAFLGDALWHPTSPRFFLAVSLILLCFLGGELYRRWKTVAIE